MNALHKDLSISALYPTASRTFEIIHFIYLLVKGGAEAVLTDRPTFSMLIIF